MKFAKLALSIALTAASYGVAGAQVSPFVSSQVDATARSCSDMASATAGLPAARAKAIAIAALEPCYDALRNLDSFEATNGATLTPDERNYFYYVGGNIIWITAGLEAMKSDNQLTEAICVQVQAAEAAWGNVRVAEASPIMTEMRTSTLRRMLLPACQAALGGN